MNESANHSKHVGAISDCWTPTELATQVVGGGGDVRAATLPIPVSEGLFLRRSLNLKLTQEVFLGLVHIIFR